MASNGYYTAPQEGYYACAAQIRLDSFSGAYARVTIALNGGSDVNSGLHSIEGNAGSTNYRSMRVAGTIFLQKGWRTSVQIYSANDNSWRAQSESGFSCHMLKTESTSGCGCTKLKTSGFNAELKGNIGAGNGWREIVNYRTNGNNELYESTGEFNEANGRFSPKTDGYYLCSANVRLDSFSGSYARLLIAINNAKDVNNGLHTIEGSGRSTNYFSLQLSGSIQVKKGQYVSAFIYSGGDNSYTIHSESGFSCHQLGTAVGFHADKSGNQGAARCISGLQDQTRRRHRRYY